MKKLFCYIKWGATATVILFCLFCLISCGKIQYVPIKEIQFEKITQHDTIIKTVLVPYRDTVYLKGDTASYLRNEYAESWARWIDGGLSHSLNILTDSIPVRVVYQNVDRFVYVDVPIEVERKLSKWEQFKMDVGGWAIGVLSGVVLLGIYGLIRKLRR